MCMLSADFCGHLKTHAEVCHAVIDATMPARASDPIPRDTEPPDAAESTGEMRRRHRSHLPCACSILRLATFA